MDENRFEQTFGIVQCVAGGGKAIMWNICIFQFKQNVDRRLN